MPKQEQEYPSQKTKKQEHHSLELAGFPLSDEQDLLIKQQVILSDFLGTNDEIYIGAQAGGS
jgi:hypothetical protein